MAKRKRDPKVTSRIMSKIRSKNTKVELLLAKALRKAKIRFRRYPKLPGKPDFALVDEKIAIFCDGDFWHGHNWKIRGMRSQAEEFRKLSLFWVRKIKNNTRRDKKVNKALKKADWVVLRFWESTIKSNPAKVIGAIRKAIKHQSLDQ